jgi:hypothetical protein
MPITPFHFGPGALVAIAAPRRVSFLAFCAANVLIDCESLYNMTTGQPRIHTFLHTYVGASLAAGATVLLFLLARRVMRSLPDYPIFNWRRLAVSAVALGAVLGAWSHVVLDSIMHADITPLAPFSDRNVLYHVVSMRALHLGCVVAGAVALAAWLFRKRE